MRAESTRGDVHTDGKARAGGLLTEEPGGLLCMGSQRVRQLSTSMRQSSSAMKWISSDILDS